MIAQREQFPRYELGLELRIADRGGYSSGLRNTLPGAYRQNVRNAATTGLKGFFICFYGGRFQIPRYHIISYLTTEFHLSLSMPYILFPNKSLPSHFLSFPNLSLPRRVIRS